MSKPESPEIKLSALLSIIEDAGSDSDQAPPARRRLEALKAWRDGLLRRSELKQRLKRLKQAGAGEAPVAGVPAPISAEPLPASKLEPAPAARLVASPLRLAELIGERQAAEELDFTKLDAAREVSRVGSVTPEFPYYGRVKRFFARVVGRSVLHLAGIVTAHQRIYNEALLDFAADSGTKLGELGSRLDLMEQNTGRLADAVGAAIYEREARTVDGIQQLYSRLQGLHSAVEREIGQLQNQLQSQLQSLLQEEVQGRSDLRKRLFENDVRSLEQEHRLAGVECDRAWLRLTEAEHRQELGEIRQRHEALAEDLGSLRKASASHAQALLGTDQRLKSLEPLTAELAALNRDQAQHRETFTGLSQRLEQVTALSQDVQSHGEGLGSLAQRLEQLEIRAREADALDRKREALQQAEARFDALDQRLNHLSAQAEDQIRREDLEALAQRLHSADGASPAATAGHLGRDLDAFYINLENQFRGPRELIKERLEAYLPLLAGNEIGTAERPVLDVGCGRGEWLELLADRGHVGRGIEINQVAASNCRELGLDVTAGDALSYLQGLPADKLGMLTAFHVVEHVPFEYVIDLLDETLRVLRPGGLALFETPNPENVAVASTSFYCDPTHRRPIHPEVMLFALRQRGFVGLDLRRPTESRPDDRLPELDAGDALAEKLNPIVSLLNRHFAAAVDFTVIGRKPGH